MSRLISFLLLIFLVPTLVFANPTPPGGGAAPDSQPSSQPSAGAASVTAGIDDAMAGTSLTNFCGNRLFQQCVQNIVGAAINVVLSLVGIILLGYTMYAGFLWMSSGGEKERAEEAMKMIRHAVVGLLIVVLSFALSSFVLTSLDTISRTTPPSAPTPPGTP